MAYMQVMEKMMAGMEAEAVFVEEMVAMVAMAVPEGMEAKEETVGFAEEMAEMEVMVAMKNRNEEKFL
jgi:hypothetical protein